MKNKNRYLLTSIMYDGVQPVLQDSAYTKSVFHNNKNTDFGLMRLFYNKKNTNINININDIKIFEKKKNGDQGYNLGDILNMPYFWAEWQNNPHHGNRYETVYKVACEDWKDGSILSYYCKSRTDETEPIPNIQRIRDSIDEYIYDNSNNQELQNLISKVSDNSVLLIHVRSGDYGIVEEYYINIIKKISQKYSKIIFICGIHDNSSKVPSNKIKQNLIDSLEKITYSIGNINYEINFNKADYHVVMMRKCKNLLVHKNGFSILGTIAFTGNNLYITKLFNAKDNEELIFQIQNVQLV